MPMYPTSGSGLRKLQGAAALRLERRIYQELGIDVNFFYQNTRRLSRFNDEEAWEADGWNDQGQPILLYSWTTITELLRQPELTVSIDDDGRYNIS